VNSSIKSLKTRQLVLALLIGDRSELDQKTLQSFTNAGVVHILAISGLHVGILYMFLLILMKFCDRKRSLIVLRTVIIVLVIWAYALLTGFSPSVSRAATMFTLFALAKLINRDVSVFNLIAASAFLNLLINPLLIFHVGFQLSYAAVAGIVFFVPFFNNYISFSHRIPDYFFKLFTVSLAAQIATFPISVYYFNQFPTYFWMSNLLVIPLVFLIVICSVLFISFSSIGFIGSFFSIILNLLSVFINYWVDLINILPYSLIEDIRLSLPETLMLMLFIWFMFSWFKFKKSSFAILSLATICSFLIFNVRSKVNCLSNHQVIVYHSRKELHIGIYSGMQNTLLTTAVDIYSSKDYEFYFKKHWLGMGVDQKINIRQLDKNKCKDNVCEKENFSLVNLIKSNSGANYMILRKESQQILKQNSFPKLSLIIGENLLPPDFKCSVEMIILPASISHFYAKHWINYASENNIRYFDVM
jgi:competence protein ComEC